jgi:hypothetical protein
MSPRRYLEIGIVVLGIVVSARIFRLTLADAPSISNVAATNTTATSTTITWTSNVNTDSFVNISQDTNYCGIRNAVNVGTQHTVVVPNLTPGTTYFYRIDSTDVNGNQSFSGNYTVTTPGPASGASSSSAALAAVTNPKQQQLTAQALAAIGNLNSPSALAAVEQALAAQANQVVGAPKILGDPQLQIGTDQATISWNTDQPANGIVFIASAAEYAPGSANPYPREERDPNTNTTTHTVVVAGLAPSTEYHYEVSSAGQLGPAGVSGDLTFTTKAVLPTILNPHLVKVGEHDATVSWGTPMPSAGTVVYKNLSTNQSLSIGDPSFLVTHIIQLTNLVFQTRYAIVIQATNQAGDVVTSTPIYFVTTKNLTPPIISQVNNDSTLYPGQDTTVQTVISWQTDEPASCNVSYTSSAAQNAADVASTTPETALLTKHVTVVTDFQPATVYRYWITCTDADGNTTSSQDFVLLTPQQQKSIIDIIIQNFQGTFGWLNGVGGAKK